MQNIIESMDVSKEMDLPEIYVFICMLLNDELIFFNFFENLFVETFLAYKRTKSAESLNLMKKIIFIISRICKLNSLQL